MEKNQDDASIAELVERINDFHAQRLSESLARIICGEIDAVILPALCGPFGRLMP